MIELLEFLGYRLKAKCRADLDFILENECDEYVDYLDDSGNGYTIMAYNGSRIYFYFKNNKLIDTRPFYKPNETITIMPTGDNKIISGKCPDDNYINEFNNVAYLNNDIEDILGDDLIKASISYLAVGLDLYIDNADLLASTGEKYKSRYEPMGVELGSSSVYIMGKVKEVEKIRNEYTGIYYYVCSVKIAKRFVTILFDDSEENKKLRKGAIVRGEVKGFGRVVPLFEGFSSFFGYGIHNNEYPNIRSILDLYNASYAAYSIDTTYSGCREDYSIKYRTYGQCCITALLVNELTGASIYRYDDGDFEHFFNKLNGEVIDLTSEYYDFKGGLDYDLSKPFDKESIKSEHFYKRYELFKNNVKAHSGGYFYYDHTALSSFGYYVNQNGVYKTFGNILDFKHDTEITPYRDHNGGCFICSVNNQAQVWYYVDGEYISTVIPFYEGGNMMEVNNVRWHKNNDGSLNKCVIDCDTLEGFPLRGFNISKCWMNKLNKNISYRLELSLIAEGAILYNDIEAWKEEHEGFSEESIFPPATVDLTTQNDNNIKYMLAGRIKSAKKILNLKTNNYYYEIIISNYLGELLVVVGANKLAAEPKIGNILFGEFEGTVKLCNLFEGFDDFKDLKIEKSTNRHLATILDLYRALYESYSLESCFYYSREWWSKANRTIGQCCLASMLVYDLIGADMYMINDDEMGQHYYNMLDGKVLDLTSEQYEIYGHKFDYSKGFRIERGSIKSENCLKRYNILIDNIKKYLEELDEFAS